MRDYWSFPAVLDSFRATKYGKYKTIEGLEWRIRGGDYVLITPPQSMFTIPDGANPKRIRSMSFIEGAIGDEVPKKTYDKVYHCDHSWTPNRKTRYELRLAERDGAKINYLPKREDLVSCVDWWIKDLEEAKPKTMIVKNHYYKMIDERDMAFISCVVDGKTIGASGYTKDGRDGAICFTKCTRSYRWVSRLLWATSIKILINAGCDFINCGDTANRFKEELGLSHSYQYKVDFSKF